MAASARSSQTRATVLVARAWETKPRQRHSKARGNLLIERRGFYSKVGPGGQWDFDAEEYGRYRDMKLHSILFGWSDPDQALRVAAGILGKRASDGLRPSGHYCQRCEAFLTKYRTWEPQSGVGLELEDMVKTN